MRVKERDSYIRKGNYVRRVTQGHLMFDVYTSAGTIKIYGLDREWDGKTSLFMNEFRKGDLDKLNSEPINMSRANRRIEQEIRARREARKNRK